MRRFSSCLAALIVLVELVAPAASAEDARGATPAELSQASREFHETDGRKAAAGSGDPQLDADDPRGDITGVVVDNATETDTITVGIEVVEGDRFSSEEWAIGFTGIVWALSTNGDTDPEWVVTIVSDGVGHVAVRHADGDDDAPATCSGEALALPADGLYGAVFASSCIGRPSTLRTAAYMAYDWAYDCASCAVSEDGTSWTATAARGGAAGSAPSPSSPSPQEPAPTTRGGYYFVARDGGVFAYGAPFHGSAAGQTTSPVVGMAANPVGDGYWIVEANGRVHSRGVGHHGDMAGRQLTAPIVGIAATADGRGYYLLGADGGVFTFGTAPFHGSTGATVLNEPVIAMATS